MSFKRLKEIYRAHGIKQWPFADFSRILCLLQLDTDDEFFASEIYIDYLVALEVSHGHCHGGQQTMSDAE